MDTKTQQAIETSAMEGKHARENRLAAVAEAIKTAHNGRKTWEMSALINHIKNMIKNLHRYALMAEVPDFSSMLDGHCEAAFARLEEITAPPAPKTDD